MLVAGDVESKIYFCSAVGFICEVADDTHIETFERYDCPLKEE